MTEKTKARPVRVHFYALPDGSWIEERPDLEAALLEAYWWNYKDDKAAEVEIAPGVWHAPSGTDGHFISPKVERELLNLLD